jgi:hypothetical protein
MRRKLFSSLLLSLAAGCAVRQHCPWRVPRPSALDAEAGESGQGAEDRPFNGQSEEDQIIYDCGKHKSSRRITWGASRCIKANVYRHSGSCRRRSTTGCLQSSLSKWTRILILSCSTATRASTLSSSTPKNEPLQPKRSSNQERTRIRALSRPLVS